MATVYLQAVPGENLHAKPLGTKTWRKPGQINNYTCRKEREKQNAMVWLCTSPLKGLDSMNHECKHYGEEEGVFLGVKRLALQRIERSKAN